MKIMAGFLFCVGLAACDRKPQPSSFVGETAAVGGSDTATTRTTTTTTTLATAITTTTILTTTVFRPPPEASTVVLPEGGTVVLPGFGQATFPGGAFASAQQVTLSATSDPETRYDFEQTAHIFGVGGRTSYELRINSGPSMPQTDLEVVIAVPPDFLSIVPKDFEIRVMAQIFQDGGEEILDSFELLDRGVSRYSTVDNTVTVTLPPEAFTNRRRADDMYEAIIVLTTVPTQPVLPPTLPSIQKQGQLVPSEQPIPLPSGAMGYGPASSALPITAQSVAVACEGSRLGPPLDDLYVTSPFNKSRKHHGTDYRAVDGTPVRAMAAGTVAHVGFDERPLKKPDPRSGKMVKGWGRYVVIKHPGGAYTLYAHLQRDSVVKKNDGESVEEGEIIAFSDNSGGSTGPHLHVQYAPSGSIYDKDYNVDPEPCIGQNITGSITVWDNGSLADDAFDLAINGVVVCTTTVGASNTCAVGNLRSGTATLTLIAVIAPDDVGTYEVALADGLTFLDGSTTREGTLPHGGSVSFSIMVPNR